MLSIIDTVVFNTTWYCRHLFFFLRTDIFGIYHIICVWLKKKKKKRLYQNIKLKTMIGITVSFTLKSWLECGVLLQFKFWFWSVRLSLDWYNISSMKTTMFSCVILHFIAHNNYLYCENRSCSYFVEPCLFYSINENPRLNITLVTQYPTSMFRRLS